MVKYLIIIAIFCIISCNDSRISNAPVENCKVMETDSTTYNCDGQNYKVY